METQAETMRPRDAGRALRACPGRAACRVCAALALAGCLAALGLGTWLVPDARGYGTHEQLGSGPCGWLLVTGYPCPTCGMTTALAHTVRGEWRRAFLAQPAGFVLALVALAGVAAASYVLIAGRWPGWIGPALTPYRVFFTVLLVLLGGWGFKLAVGLLHGSWPLR